jgi:hypothetical protein
MIIDDKESGVRNAKTQEQSNVFTSDLKLLCLEISLVEVCGCGVLCALVQRRILASCRHNLLGLLPAHLHP